MKMERRRSYTDYSRKSSISFKIDPIPIDWQCRERINSPIKDDVSFIDCPQNDPIRRVSSSLATIEKISRIKLARKERDEIESISKEEDDLILQRERGSTRRSTILLDPSVFGKFSVGSAGISGHSSTVQVRLSDDVPVRNMHVDPPPSNDLPADEADAYATIIDGMLDQLELIRYTIPAEVNVEWDECYKTMEEKYGGKNFDELQSLPNDDTEVISSKSSTMEKLQRDRTYIYNVLKNLAIELRSRRRLDSFEKEIDNIVKTTEAERNLEINYEIWTEQLAQLNELIASEKKNNEIQVEKLLAQVKESAAKIENAIFLCGSRLGFVEKWEKARLEQQKLSLEVEEQQLQNELSEYMKMESADNIISDELQVFLETDVAKMEAEIEIWSNRYNDDLDQCQRDIEYFDERIKDVKEALEQKYKLRDKRQIFIDDYEEAQRVKAKEAEYWTAIHRAATIIQSLWRGYMVRHQLGQYFKLWVKLKRRKKLAAKKRRKRKARLKKIAALKAKADKKRK